MNLKKKKEKKERKKVKKAFEKGQKKPIDSNPIFLGLYVIYTLSIIVVKDILRNKYSAIIMTHSIPLNDDKNQPTRKENMTWVTMGRRNICDFL